MGKKFYRINHYIQAKQLRVIGEDGKQIGVLSAGEALTLARERGLDLVEIAAQANPPVAKIIDFKKFLYQEEKKEREGKKKAKGGEVKGVRITPFIASADLDVRIRKAEEFLKDGNKVRVSVRFMGRQLGKREFGYELIKRFAASLSAISQEEGIPKWFGRDLVVTLTPIKNPQANKQEEKDVNQKTQSQAIDSQKV